MSDNNDNNDTGNIVIKVPPLVINIPDLVNEFFAEVPAWQRQQLVLAIRRDFDDMAKRSQAEQLRKKIDAVAEISPALADKIRSLPTADLQEKGLVVVAAVLDLVTALSNRYNEPPDPKTITRIIINIEGPDIQQVIGPLSPEDPETTPTQ